MQLTEHAKRTRIAAIRLCQEMDESLRTMKSPRAKAACLTSELGREAIGLEARVRRSAQIRRGTSPVDYPSSGRLPTKGWLGVAADPAWGWVGAPGCTHEGSFEGFE
jgi:hypothetical protein